VPSARRAQTAATAAADASVPIAVAVWSKDSTSSVLNTVVEATKSLIRTLPR
jgi:hypothetical protein